MKLLLHSSCPLWYMLACHQEEENDQKLDDEGRRALLSEARDLVAELARWKVSMNGLLDFTCREGSQALGCLVQLTSSEYSLLSLGKIEESRLNISMRDEYERNVV